MSTAPDLAFVPPRDTPVPPAVRQVAGRVLGVFPRHAEPIWQNQVGGLTFRVGSSRKQFPDRDGPPPDRYIKWNPAGSGESLADEVERLTWLQSVGHPAPKPLLFCGPESMSVSSEYRPSFLRKRESLDGGELLVTEAIAAKSAVDPYWIARPDRAVAAIAEGLRQLHSLPVESCSFDWSVEARLRERSVRAGEETMPESGSSDTPSAQNAPARTTLAWLAANAPSIDRLVVCHGDACAPNTLIDDEGNFAGTVDAARIGVADRWADLAVATLSFQWNYSDYDESVFWETYGVEPDPDRISYYRALWNAE